MEDHGSPIPNRDHEGAVGRLTPEDIRFIEAVKRGEDDLECGEFLSHEQVGQRLERFLES